MPLPAPVTMATFPSSSIQIPPSLPVTKMSGRLRTVRKGKGQPRACPRAARPKAQAALGSASPTRGGGGNRRCPPQLFSPPHLLRCPGHVHDVPSRVLEVGEGGLDRDPAGAVEPHPEVSVAPAAP